MEKNKKNQSPDTANRGYQKQDQKAQPNPKTSGTDPQKPYSDDDDNARARFENDPQQTGSPDRKDESNRQPGTNQWSNSNQNQSPNSNQLPNSNQSSNSNQSYKPNSPNSNEGLNQGAKQGKEQITNKGVNQDTESINK